MTGTLYSHGLLNAPIAFVLATVIGFAFGACLERAGFGSSRKLTAIFYLRDMAVLKVMFSAVVTALVGYRYLLAFGWLKPTDVHILETYWGAQAVGGLLFGVGFVMGGWCPGTAYVGAASGKLDALVFLGGAVLGSILFNEVFPLVQAFYASGGQALYLPESLGVSWRVFPLLFCVAAVGTFVLSTWLERKIGGKTDQGDAAAHGGAAVLLLLLAAGLIFVAPPAADTPAPAPPAPLSSGGILKAVAAAEDHIDPEELAGALVDQQEHLLLVDLRNAARYAAFHIRGAINIPLEELALRLPEIPRDRRVVLYSNGTTHAAQAWSELRRLGWMNVYVLTDGILEFWRQCLTPPSLQGVTDPTAALAARERYMLLRGYFVEGLDLPAAVVPAPPPGAAAFATAVMKATGLAGHLVSTQWLADNMADGDLRVIDTRAGSKDYNGAHIPGAVYLGVENLRTTINGVHSVLMPADELARTFGRLGIGRKNAVIVYSDQLRDATFVALALARVGHHDYAVLNGGFEVWQSERRPVTAALPSIAPVTYRPRGRADTFTVSADYVNKASTDGKTVIIDVRPPASFSGAKQEEARAGHIPGARNRHFEMDIAADNASMWKSRSELAAAYAALGVKEDTRVIVHCRTGHQASQTYFLLKHLLGVKDVRWYDGSWLEWAARPDLPAATD